MTRGNDSAGGGLSCSTTPSSSSSSADESTCKRNAGVEDASASSSSSSSGEVAGAAPPTSEPLTHEEEEEEHVDDDEGLEQQQNANGTTDEASRFSRSQYQQQREEEESTRHDRRREGKEGEQENGPPQQQEPLWLRIIQINDVYQLDNFPSLANLIRHKSNEGYYQKNSFSDNSEDNVEDGMHQSGGGQNQQQQQQQQQPRRRQRSFDGSEIGPSKPDKVLIVMAGDFLAPYLLSSLDFGAGMVDCMNALGFTHACFGNHETDLPEPRYLAQRIVDSHFVWVNTNMPQLPNILNNAYCCTTTKETEDADGGEKNKNGVPIRVETPTHDVVAIVPSCEDEDDDSKNGHGTTKRKKTKKVGLIGLLSNDPTLYRPNSFAGAKIVPVVEATESFFRTTRIEEDGVTDGSSDEDHSQHAADVDDDVDLWIPMTHQSITDDRKFAQHFGGTNFPLVVGGHDHEPYDEVVNGCRIVKAGQDATHAAITDIVWWSSDDDGNNNNNKSDGDDENDISKGISNCIVSHGSSISSSNLELRRRRQNENMTIDVHFDRTDRYDPDPDMVERVERHHSIVKELERATLFNVSQWVENRQGGVCPRRGSLLGIGRRGKDYDDSVVSNQKEIPVFSTSNNRLQDSTGTSAFCEMLRMGMRCDGCIINAGSVRANKDYPRRHNFTWSDLKDEIPFPTYMVSCRMPGRVLEASIRHSRTDSRRKPTPVARGGYIHTCHQIHYVEEEEGDRGKGRILSVQGEPFDPEREYVVALPAQFFHGIDDHEPLLRWAAETGYRCDTDAAHPAKLVIVGLFSSLIWLRMGSFDEIDADHDGYLSREDVRRRLAQVFGDERMVSELAVDSVFSIADIDGKGKITPLEMILVEFCATDSINHIDDADQSRTLTEIAARVFGVSLKSDSICENAGTMRTSHDGDDEKSDKGEDLKDVAETNGHGHCVEKNTSISTAKMFQKIVQEIRLRTDANGDGKISREEVMQVIGELNRKDLLS